MFGNFSISSEPYPRLIRELRIFQTNSVSAGHNFSGAIDVEGRVFLWGLGREFQLGLGPKPDNISPLPQQVSATGLPQAQRISHLLILGAVLTFLWFHWQG